MKKLMYTIGHSTRSVESFIELLKIYELEMVVDVRTIPMSRRNPQYNQEDLKTVLNEFDIEYRHLSKLGGLRHTTKKSINLGWNNLSFRGFADYMQTASFLEGVSELEQLGKKFKCAIMCAEAVPWRCHRSLIADFLTINKWKVFHIIGKKNAKLHVVTSFMEMINGQIIYPKNADSPTDV